METNREVKPIEVDYLCGECNNGYMRPDGRILLISPPKFPHTCENCGNKENLSNKYPYVTYEKID